MMTFLCTHICMLLDFAFGPEPTNLVGDDAQAKWTTQELESLGIL